MSQTPPQSAVFRGLVDLASERLGGRALATNDEFFASAGNLVKSKPAVFDPDRYDDHGKWMDGWESRRRRSPGHDWCIVRLGAPGVVRGVDVDTRHFLGNHPPYAALDGCEIVDDGSNPDGSNPAEVIPEEAWHELLPRSPLEAGQQNLYAIASDRRVTHVRLRIFPDGGVARLRVYGEVRPDWQALAGSGPIDLAAMVHGGRAVAASDMFFSPMGNLLLPGPSTYMGDGWETRRRRGPGHDWVILRLGRAGRLDRVTVETHHFKGNAPDRISIDACADPGGPVDGLSAGGLAPPDVAWVEILPSQRLDPHASHEFESLVDPGPWSYLRIHVYPDGGISRVRVWGNPVEIGVDL